MKHSTASCRPSLDIVVLGGGAAGYFGAIAAAASAPGARVEIWEKGHEVLSKVRISGGGRCNVTHHCEDPRLLASHYPRGGRELMGPFHSWQPRDTIRWFQERGVKLKVESDGRMFPTSDDSATIVDCLQAEVRRLGIQVRTGRELVSMQREGNLWMLGDRIGETWRCRKVLLATGGLKGRGLQECLKELGHTVEPPVPSLFTFRIRAPWLNSLAGISLEQARVECPAQKLSAEGPLLITHRGLSGPAVLRLSAWGARSLHDLGYRFECVVAWTGESHPEKMRQRLRQWADRQPRKLPSNTPLEGIPRRLWEALLSQAWPGHTKGPWSQVSSRQVQDLARQLAGTVFQVDGKDTNKEEFVTCGGVRNAEVHFKTMESRKVPGLYFAGEVLDIDGVTGGFNFQAAWTTSMLAGRAMAEALSEIGD